MPQFSVSENAADANTLYPNATMHAATPTKEGTYCLKELDGLVVGVVLLGSLASLSILNDLVFCFH